jgi:hypothetical protein
VASDTRYLEATNTAALTWPLVIVVPPAVAAGLVGALIVYLRRRGRG